jgi:glycosyltransferase involved in cell wall biosynthesis
MHICFITSEFPKKGFPHGGVGTFIETISKALVRNSIQVSVIGINNYTHVYEEEHDGEFSVYRIQPKRVKGLTWFYNTQSIAKKIREIHLKYPINVVETAELGLAFLPKLKGIKYVIRMHGGHHFFAEAENRKREWWKSFQEKRSFNKADGIVAVSNYVAATTRRLLRLGDVPISVVYNPINLEKFYKADPAKKQPKTILFAGSIIEKKGIRQLVQALHYLVDDFPEVQLLIAGRDANVPGTKIPYRPILEKEINAAIRPHITFLGVIPNPEMVHYIEKAEVCCYPSHMEAMPLAWLEVLAMGKTFIGGSTGPGPEAVVDGVTGLLANPHDPKDIAEKIRYCFTHPDECLQMGIQARIRVIKEFVTEVTIDKNIAFYKSIIS